ncbi:MAG: hypothetical protein M1818_004234 [Claussenomyces sp. TS43310]|nr:MAG: hypothetical protein M1818_004234 [Claussenomyces sp. TS43310]
MTTFPEFDAYVDFGQAPNTISLAAGRSLVHAIPDAVSSLVEDNNETYGEYDKDGGLHSPLQPFIAPSSEAFSQPNFTFHPADTNMPGVPDIHYNSCWTHHATRPARPCNSCKNGGLDCVIINHSSGDQRHPCVCSNCLALSKPCSFVRDNARPNDSVADSGSPPCHAWSSTRPKADQQEDRRSDIRDINSSNIGEQPQLEDPSTQTSMTVSRGDSSSRSVVRFSRDTIRILRHWAAAHSKHPYPTDEEKEILMKRTGLSKSQITNWLANDRRRGQVKPNPTRDHLADAATGDEGTVREVVKSSRNVQSLHDHTPVLSVTKPSRRSMIGNDMRNLFICH